MNNKWLEKAVRKYTVWGREHPDEPIDNLPEVDLFENDESHEDDDEIYNC